MAAVVQEVGQVGLGGSCGVHPDCSHAPQPWPPITSRGAGRAPAWPPGGVRSRAARPGGFSETGSSSPPGSGPRPRGSLCASWPPAPLTWACQGSTTSPPASRPSLHQRGRFTRPPRPASGTHPVAADSWSAPAAKKEVARLHADLSQWLLSTPGAAEAEERPGGTQDGKGSRHVTGDRERTGWECSVQPCPVELLCLRL